MDPATREADRALDAFRASRTAEGRFLSYCRGRSRHFWTRIVVAIVLCPAVWYLGNLWVAMLALTVAFVGEFLDFAVLRRIGRHQALGAAYPLAAAITTLTGALQAMSNAFSIALFYSYGLSDARTLAGAVCFAGILDATLLYSVHRGASVVRIVVYALTVATVVYQEVSRAESFNRAILFDTLAVLFLVYVSALIVRHVFRTQERRNAMRMDMLEHARELAHVNAALEQSRRTTRRLAMVAEQANDSVIITDRKGFITWVNHAFSSVTGFAFAEAVGRNVTFLNGPMTDIAASDALRDARNTLQPIRQEIVNHTKDGHPLWVDVNMCPLFDDQGELLNFISIERDIGEAKERERALAEARRDAEEAVRARHSFLATMSHEIRTPMNGVIGTTDLLLETELDAQQKTLVRTIGASGESLLAIVNDILDFSKLEAGRLEVDQLPFSPADCFGSAVDIVQPLADAKGLNLELVLPSSVPSKAVGDNRRITQVLLNLLGNAIKFTEAGEVRLEVSVRLEGKQCHFLLSVRDTGIGIEKEKQDRIFESFVQVGAGLPGRLGGTGLGLSISRLLVQAMGGEIGLASSPGEGSVFHVTLALPIVEQDTSATCASPADTLESMENGELSGTVILVAEDNRTNTLLLERMLAHTGADLVYAVNGLEAVDLFELHAPALVLMDIHMPILDGLQATREIRQIEAARNSERIPIVALTANVFPEDRDLCMEAGMDDVVTKPFRKKDLMGMLHRFAPVAGRRSPVSEPLSRLAGSG